MGDDYDLMVALSCQIFEYLRETFCKRALGYLQSTLSEKNQKQNAVFQRKRLAIIDLFERLVGGGTISPRTPVLALNIRVAVPSSSSTKLLMAVSMILNV